MEKKKLNSLSLSSPLGKLNDVNVNRDLSVSFNQLANDNGNSLKTNNLQHPQHSIKSPLNKLVIGGSSKKNGNENIKIIEPELSTTQQLIGDQIENNENNDKDETDDIKDNNNEDNELGSLYEIETESEEKLPITQHKIIHDDYKVALHDDDFINDNNRNTSKSYYGSILTALNEQDLAASSCTLYQLVRKGDSQNVEKVLIRSTSNVS